MRRVEAVGELPSSVVEQFALVDDGSCTDRKLCDMIFYNEQPRTQNISHENRLIKNRVDF